MINLTQHRATQAQAAKAPDVVAAQAEFDSIQARVAAMDAAHTAGGEVDDFFGINWAPNPELDAARRELSDAGGKLNSVSHAAYVAIAGVSPPPYWEIEEALKAEKGA